jgi:hypothetical protein
MIRAGRYNVFLSRENWAANLPEWRLASQQAAFSHIGRRWTNFYQCQNFFNPKVTSGSTRPGDLVGKAVLQLLIVAQASWGLTCFAPLPAKQSCLTAGEHQRNNAETRLGLNCALQQLHHGIRNNDCSNYALLTCALQANLMIIALFCDDRRLHPSLICACARVQVLKWASRADM